jgi:parvulin-like peptidyl-prolyl isomerase
MPLFTHEAFMAKKSRKTRSTTPPTRKQVALGRREQAQRRRILIGVSTFSALIVVVLGIGIFQTAIGQTRIPIAKVNGVDISTGEFQKEVKFRRWNLLQSFGNLGADNTQLTTYLTTQLPQQVLDNMVDTELIRQEDQRRNLTVTRDEVDGEIERQFGYYTIPPTPTAVPTLQPGVAVTATPPPTATPVTEDAFKKRYAEFLSNMRDATGYSESDFRRDIENNLLRDKLQQVITSDIPVQAVQIHTRHILTDTEEAAKSIKARLDNGEDFAMVAKQASKDAVSQGKGGDLGWLLQGERSTQFDQIAFALPVDQISDPVQTSEGWDIIQVLERDDNRMLTPDQFQQRQDETFTQWLNDQRTASNIQTFLTDDKIPPLATPRPAG